MKWPELKVILGRLGVATEMLRPRSDTQVSIPCPFAKWTHRGDVDKNPSLSLYFNDPKSPTLFKCFTCLQKGRLADLPENLAAMMQWEDPEKARQFMSLAAELREEDRPNLWAVIDDAFDGIDDFVLAGESHEARTLSEAVLDGFPQVWTSMPAMRYLAERGLDDEATVRWFDLRYDPRMTRIVFPVRKSNGNLVGAVGRTIIGEPKKYHNYFGFTSGKSLGGLNTVSPDHANGCVVVEGFTDVLNGYKAADQCGMDIVCSWHAEVTKHQAEQLLRLDKPLLFCYDPDDAGDAGWEKANKTLAPMVLGGVWRARPPGDCDVGEMGHAQLLTLFGGNSDE